MDQSRLRELIRTIIHLGRHRHISFLAGGVAFFGFLSLIPATLLAVTIGSLLGGEAFVLRIVGSAGRYLSTEGNEILTSALTNSAGLTRISLVGAILLVWSTLRVVRAVDIAFDNVYEHDEMTPLVEQVKNAVVVISAITIGGLALVGAQSLIERVAIGAVSLLGLWALILSGLVVVLLPMYYVLPPIRRPVTEVLPGTFVAVVGLLLLRQTFQLYAVRASEYEAYGLVGAVVLFLLWLYFGSLILVVGAVVNAALARQETTGALSSAS